MIAALELSRRGARAGQAVAHLGVSVLLALLGWVAVVALAVGAALSMVGIGLPLLVGAAALCRWLVRLDRRSANRFLGMHIAPLPPGPGDPAWATTRSSSSATGAPSAARSPSTCAQPGMPRNGNMKPESRIEGKM